MRYCVSAISIDEYGVNEARYLQTPISIDRTVMDTKMIRYSVQDLTFTCTYTDTYHSPNEKRALGITDLFHSGPSGS